ncbi:hypothetical protein G7046_g8943 [Stylonectria norvegica]|nr:hypothetical protein G7046_g8943 [Stylonectria norvegica]
MFRRNWASLPKDVSFPSDLKGLGYFVNDDDEVRSIENPDCYFKYFINRNLRINERLRFEFNHALERIIFERLANEGLEKLSLPAIATATQPHLPIFVTRDIASRFRIVLILGEPTQDLGMLAGRVANGPGGLNQGSMVSVVRALQEQASSPTNFSPPGVVLANMGQRYWWPEGNRALTITASADIPLPSIVHAGRKYVPSLNDIPGSETANKHLETIFQKLGSDWAADHTMIDVVAIGESCDIIEKFLDNPGNWETWGSRLSSMVLIGSVYCTERLTNDALKLFLAKRARCYLLSPEPVDTPLASPSGNPNMSIEALGAPCFSSSEAQHTELILIRALSPILRFLCKVAETPGFENSPIVVVEVPETDVIEESWKQATEEEMPIIDVVDPAVIEKQTRETRRWKRFMDTGETHLTDSDDSD